MACGMPIIASAEGETERVIMEANCGVCCKIGDVNGLSDCILNLAEQDISKMADNSRKYFEKYFNKQNLMDEMDTFFNKH